MDIKKIITAYLKENGCIGLCNPDIPCGCGLDDFMPCRGDRDRMRPARHSLRYHEHTGKHHIRTLQHGPGLRGGQSRLRATSTSAIRATLPGPRLRHRNHLRIAAGAGAGRASERGRPGPDSDCAGNPAV